MRTHMGRVQIDTLKHITDRSREIEPDEERDKDIPSEREIE